MCPREQDLNELRFETCFSLFLRFLSDDEDDDGGDDDDGGCGGGLSVLVSRCLRERERERERERLKTIELVGREYNTEGQQEAEKR